MKYNLIFYLSRKTSYCEKALKKALAPIGGEAHLITSATTPVELGAQVSRSLKLCPLTVIIGGFDSSLDNMRKLSAESGSEGYIVRDKNQILLSFPDSPEDITEMCSEELLEYIGSKLNVVNGE